MWDATNAKIEAVNPGPAMLTPALLVPGSSDEPGEQSSSHGLMHFISVMHQTSPAAARQPFGSLSPPMPFPSSGVQQ